MSALLKKGGQNNYNISAFNKIKMLLWITRIPGGKKQVVKKGLLYAKIDISEAGGSFLHLFNTHTQATESELALEPYVYSFVARYE